MDEDVENDSESPSDVLAIGLSRGKALDGRQPDIVRYEDCRSVEQFLWRQPTPAVTHPAEPDPSAVPNTDASTPALLSSSVSQLPPPAEAVPSTPSVVATTNSAMPENVFAAIAELARTTQAALTQQAAAQQSFQEQLLRRLSSSTGTDSRDHQHGAASAVLTAGEAQALRLDHAMHASGPGAGLATAPATAGAADLAIARARATVANNSFTIRYSSNTTPPLTHMRTGVGTTPATDIPETLTTTAHLGLTITRIDTQIMATVALGRLQAGTHPGRLPSASSGLDLEPITVILAAASTPVIPDAKT
ncbi:hypothetical protein PInf_026330 [Phytophthora infestans]|nr:hypothetical protein PInf_028183 [Phytophthora infestans]KAI9980470.1 hypothetical protein PInf_026330 [Phytophthora infestans]